MHNNMSGGSNTITLTREAVQDVPLKPNSSNGFVPFEYRRRKTYPSEAPAEAEKTSQAKFFSSTDEGKSPRKNTLWRRLSVAVDWSWLEEPEVMIPDKRVDLSQSETKTEESNRLTDWKKKRIHHHADSLFSTGSGFTNYVGLFNLTGILLVITCTRVALENVIKYGILINPVDWMKILLTDPYSWPCFSLVLLCNVYILAALWIEKRLSDRTLSESTGRRLHWVNLFTEMGLASYVILAKHPNPVFSSAALGLYTIVFLKLISYMQVNEWCRQDLTTDGSRRYRKQSLNLSTAGYASDQTESEENIPNGIPPETLQYYPDNLNLKDMYYYMIAPTLCYELNFPRSSRIRKRFLLKRIGEMIFFSGLILGLIQQWIIPTVLNSMVPFKELQLSKMGERILKLAMPNFCIWFMFFYWFFHSCLNVVAEITKFGDRVFYRDWWNAETVEYFWSNWNIPVHRWCSRHLYKPLIKAGYSKLTAQVSVFLLSAFFHEFLVSVPLRMFRLWAFTAMLTQVPLAAITKQYLRGRWGNVVMWLTLILCQPVAILMYYHDYFVTARA